MVTTIDRPPALDPARTWGKSPSVSIIIPTIGRESLVDTIESFASDLESDDQVIICSDGPNEWVEDITEDFRHEYENVDWLYVSTEKQGGYGHPLRNLALDSFVENEWVWSLDDDDESSACGLSFVRKELLCADSDEWFIFKMRYGNGHPAKGLTLWSSQDVKIGNVGTPMIVAPVCGARFGMRSTDKYGRDFGPGYLGDIDYAHSLISELGDPTWCDETIALIRP